MEWLCVLFGALLIVTLVGHGIWLMLAAVFRGGRTSRKSLPKSPLVDEAVVTTLYLNTLRFRELIDAETHQRVLAAMDRMHPHTAPPPIPVLPVPGAEPPVPPAPHATLTIPVAPIPYPPAGGMDPQAEDVETRPAPVRVRAPRRSSGEVFAAFLRESNIRWGELMGGLLIVGCSVALVLSFWNQFASKPLFQFAIFTGVTAAAFGLGLYAEHRWKLPTTSRGILLIATLLVPLNFLAFAALSHGRSASVVVSICEVGALAVFGLLEWRAAAVLSPYWPRVLSIGVMGLSASLLATKHLGPARSVSSAAALTGFPVAICLGAMWAVVFPARRWKQVRAHAADGMFLILGVLTFACALAISLVIVGSARPWHLAHRLAPLLSLALTPALATGLLLWRRITDRRLARPRTAGTAVAVAAALLMLAAIGLAWPDPAGMLPLALIDFVLLTLTAVLFDIPAAHALATPCLGLAYAIVFHLARGHVGWLATAPEMIRALTAPAAGIAVGPLVALVALASAVLARWARPRASAFYGWSAVAFAAASLVLVSQGGFGPASAVHAQWLYLAYAAICIALAWRANHAPAGWCGWILLLWATVQSCIAANVAHPWPTALLAYATFATLAASLLRRRGLREFSLSRPARWTSVAASAAAVALLLASVSETTFADVSLRMFWVAALWMALAIEEDSFAVFTLSQVALATATLLGVLARLSLRTSFRQSTHPLLEPSTVHAAGVALGLVALVFSAGRTALPDRLKISRWLGAPAAFDRVLSCVLLASLVAGSLVGVAPAVASEFATHGAMTPRPSLAQVAQGRGAWGLLLILLAVFVTWTQERRRNSAILLMIATAVCACPMWAARWTDAAAGASAFRWALVLFLLGVSLLIWMRRRLPRGLAPVTGSPEAATDLRLFLACLTAVPIIGLSLYPAIVALEGFRIAGPHAGSWFASVSPAASYAIPLGMIAAVFVGNAMRERSVAWLAGASAVCNLAVTIAYLFLLIASGSLLDTVSAIHLIQLNAIALGLFAIDLKAVQFVNHNCGESPRLKSLAKAQTRITLAGVGAIVLVGAYWMFALPGQSSVTAAAAGAPLGWAALLVGLASMGSRGSKIESLEPGAAAMALLAIAVMVALSVSGVSQSNWLSFHVFMVGALAAMAISCALGVSSMRMARGRTEPVGAGASADAAPLTSISIGTLQYQRPAPEGALVELAAAAPANPALLRWSFIMSGLVVLLSLRAMTGDPQAPWWSMGVTASLSLLWTGLAYRLVAPRLLYAGGLLLNLAATMACLRLSAFNIFDLVSTNVAVLSVAGLAALVVHLQLFKRGEPAESAGLPFHRFAARTSTGLLVAGIAVRLGARVMGGGIGGGLLPDAAALCATIALATANLWDDESPLVFPQLYALGLASVAMILLRSNHLTHSFDVAGAVALCGYVSLASVVISLRRQLREFAVRLSIPLPPRPSDSVWWLMPANVALAAVAVGSALLADLHQHSLPLRLLAATATLVQFAALLWAGRDDRRLNVNQLILCAGVASVVAWCLAWMPPAHRNSIDRSVLVLAAFSLCGLACAIASSVASTRESSRGPALRSVLGLVAAAWGLNLLEVLAMEVAARTTAGDVSAHPAAVGAVIIALLTASILAIVPALFPARDPLRLADSRRGAFVYLSETLLALTLLHLRLTVPWLFGGPFSQYWPLVVMALAFAGVGAAEIFRRRGTLVLSSPLFRTGILLPLLPVLAFWAAPSRVELSNLLFVVGVFYAILSATRRSFVLGVVAALAANGGLWSLLSRQPHMGFLVHPQLWLVPAAVSVLIAAQLNRDRLPASQLRFVRYCCLMLVYVSSTADVFLNGVANHPMLPLVLAALSVAGVMAGLMLRVRPFLFLGSAFLAMSVITMIYYASANLHWTWLWYVAGIALGAAIIVTFALFEKKRAEMLALVDGLKQWQ